MKINLLDCFSGPGGVLEIGDVVEVSKAQGERFIKLGHAVPAKGDITDRKPEPEKPPKLKIYGGGKNDVPINWADHLAAYKKAHPDMPLKDQMKGAAESYKKVRKATISDNKGKQKVQTTSIS